MVDLACAFACGPGVLALQASHHAKAVLGWHVVLT